ncbi:hypothetical protein [Xylocopilactobacillus apicola]|uniref:hypothetical protein n=1 Tax=Xylocopilactobacillus apicola TaxID=2932184 RepID=UPI00295315C9|nr:hypothetical protein [Xylocopilactobacillus apicola]
MIKSSLPVGVALIIHSDQRRQYQKRIQAMGLTASMSCKKNCYDNAPMESFFNLMKRERLNRQPIADLIKQNGLTPIEYRERKLAA